MSDRRKPFIGGKDVNDDNGSRTKRLRDDNGIPNPLIGSESNEVEVLYDRRTKTVKYSPMMNPTSSYTHADAVKYSPMMNPTSSYTHADDVKYSPMMNPTSSYTHGDALKYSPMMNHTSSYTHAVDVKYSPMMNPTSSYTHSNVVKYSPMMNHTSSYTHAVDVKYSPMMNPTSSYTHSDAVKYSPMMNPTSSYTHADVVKYSPMMNHTSSYTHAVDVKYSPMMNPTSYTHADAAKYSPMMNPASSYTHADVSKTQTVKYSPMMNPASSYTHADAVKYSPMMNPTSSFTHAETVKYSPMMNPTSSYTHADAVKYSPMMNPTSSYTHVDVSKTFTNSVVKKEEEIRNLITSGQAKEWVSDMRLGISSEEGCKELKLSSDSLPYSANAYVVDYKNPLAITDVINHVENGQYGSVTKDIDALITRKMQILGPYFAQHPSLINKYLKGVTDHEETHPLENIKVTGMSHQNVKNFDFDRRHIQKDVAAPKREKNVPAAPIPVFHQFVSLKPIFHRVLLPKRETPAIKMIGYQDAPNYAYPGESSGLNPKISLPPTYSTRKDKGVYVGVHEEEDNNVAAEDNSVYGRVQEEEDNKVDAEDTCVYTGVQEEEDNKVDVEDDGLEDMWREMSMAIETSKDVSADPPPEDEEEDPDCDHSFILKDDLGYVCRVCGVIDKGIETIFEFQYKVKRSTRTCMSDSSKAKEKVDAFGVKIAEEDFLVTDISAHPRHANQMKPHQVEGFNFLARNLAGDHPGGCILAHAPGSGKTFMIISFMQSFLGKYPDARPLVVLPKGILSTWKKEFQTWQVEDIPLYDLYTVRADSRPQQLAVLKQWMDNKSILFLGYKQLANIVCDKSNNNATISCQEILLKVPSLLILDEGHTPRNENTEMVQSLAKIQTPRKVVLSGTLYQNHVREVFNVLNLVRPKFLNMEASKPIVRRIQSRIHMPGVKRFDELVENILQKDPDFKRKVAVIHDLREMTSKVLHYYRGDFLDELPGLVDFTVLLKLTPRQKHELKIVKMTHIKFKKSSVGSAVYMHPNLKPIAENNDEKSTYDHIKMDEFIKDLDVGEGVKSKFFRNMLNLCESAGEKLLVFSQYLLTLKYLERLAMKWKGWSLGKEIFVISGESSAEQREFSMEKFNNSPEAKVLFGSIRACSEGISLVGASRVIILDVHLNPSVTRQAIGRAFRPGQKKKVFVYRLIAADSPEEEDHRTCFKKELISKMWFEWNEYCGERAFQVETLDVKECGDLFLESPLLGEDVKAVYKR